MTTISERTWQGSQSWNYEHTYAAADGTRLRVRIKRDSYDAQSYGEGMRWNGEEWKRVVRITHDFFVALNFTAGTPNVEARRFAPTAAEIARELESIALGEEVTA